ncbi:fimbrial protein [Pseudomonas graminis]
MKFFGMKILMACCALVSSVVQAECTIFISAEENAGHPTTLDIPSELLKISADLPVDTSTPFITLTSSTSAHAVNYINCADSDRYGSSVINPSVPVNKMYPTNIEGIGIKVRRDNAAGSSTFLPYSGGATAGSPSRLIFRQQSFYLVDFFKTAETVKLIPDQVNTVLYGGDLAYTWVLNDSIASYAQKLIIGNITVVSTPACTFESSKSIDFNTVTPSMADSGVERPLNFEMNCRTDYGQYSVLASIIANARTSDSKYIAVTDAGGNTDRLRIEIKDDQDENVAVDGTISKKVTSTNKVPAQFKWTATLSSFGVTSKRPTDGKFDARAEIVLQVN